MNKKRVLIAVVIGVVLLAAGFFAGKVYENNRLSYDFVESIEYCEDNDQVLRLWDWGSDKPDIRPECWGELGEGDLHVWFSEEDIADLYNPGEKIFYPRGE